MRCLRQFVCLQILLLACAASARTLTWQGANGGKWSVAANWLDGSATATTAPADGDIVKFTNSSALSVTNDLTNLLVGGIALFNTKNLTISGNAFRYSGEITMNTVSANVTDTIKPAIELTTDLIVRFKYGTGNKSHQIKFDGVLSGAGGLAVDTSGGSGESAIYLNALNTFTGEVNYTGNNGYVCTYFKTIANAGEPSSFGAGMGGVVFSGRLYAQSGTGTGGETDRSWVARKINGWDLKNANPLVFNSTFNLSGSTGLGFTGTKEVRFNGQVLGFAGLKSTNGNVLRFNSADNTASSAGNVILNQTSLYAKKLADSGQQSSIGTGNLIQLGQEHDTPSTVYYTGAEAASCNRTIDVICQTSATTRHTIAVTSPAGSLDLSGTIKSSTSTTPVFTLSCTGRIRTSGTMRDTYSVSKTGTNWWTHAGTATYPRPTTVSAGTFELNGTMASAVTVASGAYLSGGGTASSNVTLQAGSGFTVTSAANTLDIAGKLTVGGNITLNVPSDWDGTQFTVMRYGSYSASGSVTVRGAAFDVRTVFNETSLVVMRDATPQSSTWDGGGGSNTSIGEKTNWEGDVLPDLEGRLTPTFASGGTVATIDRGVIFAGLVFNTADAGFSLVGGGSIVLREGGISAIGADVAKTYAIETPVTLDGAQTWSVGTGAEVAMEGSVGALTAAALTKTGKGRLTLTAQNTFTGTLAIDAGDVHLYGGATLGAGGVGKVTIKWPDAKLYLHNAAVDRVLETSGAAGAASPGSIEAFEGRDNVLRRAVTRTGGNLRLYAQEDARLVIAGGLRGNWFHPDGGGEFIITDTPLDCTYFGAYTGSATVRFQVASNSCAQLGLDQGCSATYHFDVDEVFAKRNSAYPDLYSGTGGSAAVYLHGTKQHVRRFGVTYDGARPVLDSADRPGAELYVDQSSAYSYDNHWLVRGHVSIFKSGSATLKFDRSGTATGTLSVSKGLFELASGVTWVNATNVVSSGTGTFKFARADAFSRTCDFTVDGANAKLDLAYDGTAVCRRLHMRNERGLLRPVPPGVYGAVDNPRAQYGLANITGTGLLRVRQSDVGFVMVLRRPR